MSFIQPNDSFPNTSNNIINPNKSNNVSCKNTLKQCFNQKGVCSVSRFTYPTNYHEDFLLRNKSTSFLDVRFPTKQNNNFFLNHNRNLKYHYYANPNINKINNYINNNKNNNNMLANNIFPTVFPNTVPNTSTTNSLPINTTSNNNIRYNNTNNNNNNYINFLTHYKNYNTNNTNANNFNANHIYNSTVPNEYLKNIKFPKSGNNNWQDIFNWVNQASLGMSNISNNKNNLEVPNKPPCVNWNIAQKNDKINNCMNLFKPITLPSPHNNYEILKKQEPIDFHKIYLDKCTRVIIFDLDDTLIPTSYIRSELVDKYYLNQKKALQEIKTDIQLNKNFDFEHILCTLLKYAKSLSHTVVIVTNARSDKWIDTVKFIFPQFASTIEECNIPLMRTDQFGEPSPLNIYEYFHFWMNAKKQKFNEVLQSHCNIHRQHTTNKIDFISIGDSGFEEIAAYELFTNNKSVLKRALSIKCEAGLNVNEFVNQLDVIHLALSIISKPGYSCKFLSLSANVHIKTFI